MESFENIIKIRIINWNEHNPKRDQKSYSWLRLSNDIPIDPKLYGLDAEQKWAWIVILCQASKKNEDTISLNLEWLNKHTDVKLSKITTLLIFLENSRVIEIVEGRCRDHDNARSCISSSTTPTYERTNVRTNESTDDIRANKKPEDLVKVWNSTCLSLPKVERLTASRKAHAKARLTENPDLSYWEDVAKKIEASDFCKGTAQSSRGWIATFDWFLKPDTHVKVLEGKYGSSQGKSPDQMSLVERIKLMQKGIPA